MYGELGEAAWAWVLGQIRQADGPWLPEEVPDGGQPGVPGEDRDSVYAGIGGLALVLAEIGQSRALSGAEQALAAGITARLSATAPLRADPSLYTGLGGDVTALKLLAPGSERVALRQLAALMTPAGWNIALEITSGSPTPAADLVLGTAGVILAAIWAGGEHARDIAVTGGEALLQAADRTRNGLDWAMLPGRLVRMPNYSHGTAGIAAALAIAGAELGRDDFIAAARQGAQHLLAAGSLDDGGFVLPRTVPHSRPDMEEVTYTWCHGPAGTSYLFAALKHAGVDSVAGLEVTALRHRCLHSILVSGVPRRLRPGFWDNDGRCCGTAGVGEVLLDAAQDCADPADRLAATGGARYGRRPRRARHPRQSWGTVAIPGTSSRSAAAPPGTSWMQGAAGIAAFLLRLARVIDNGLGTPVIDRPDQWWAIPARLRTIRTEPSARRRQP